MNKKRSKCTEPQTPPTNGDYQCTIWLSATTQNGPTSCDPIYNGHPPPTFDVHGGGTRGRQYVCAIHAGAAFIEALGPPLLTGQPTLQEAYSLPFDATLSSTVMQFRKVEAAVKLDPNRVMTPVRRNSCRRSLINPLGSSPHSYNTLRVG
jgi:hypothetical protein